MVDDEIEVPVWLELTGQTPEEAREKWARLSTRNERGQSHRGLGLDSLKKGTAMNKSSGCVAPTDSTAGFSSRAVPVREKTAYARADRHFHRHHRA